MAEPSSLSDLLTVRQIKQLASETTFARGKAYCTHGHVCSIVVHGETLTAAVTGTEEYAVRLSAKDGTLAHRCSCPMGADGEFCKHCVATALAWLEAGQSTTKDGVTPLVKLDDLRPFLLKQDREALTIWLLEAAERDDRLRERLLRNAARAAGKCTDFTSYRRAIDQATRTGGFIDYGAAHGFAESVREAVEPVRELLTEDASRHGDTVIELVEHALARVEDALNEADDSNGEIGSLLGELQELHLAACKAARPEPETLATRLFEWEMQDGWDVFHHAVVTYADILGPAGLAVYRRLAETAWRKLPLLRAGDHEDYPSNRFRLTSIMEALAQTSGDLAALVAIKSKNLSHPYNYLVIAGLYRDANQRDTALDWAERGLKAFPKAEDPRLLEFLADEYHRLKRHADAIALIWRSFETRPGLDTYRRVKEHADRANAWPQWRERALAALRQTTKQEGGGKTHGSIGWSLHFAHATLVEIHLWEKDYETAWQEAFKHPIDRGLTLQLAAVREKTHPAEAIPLYLREAEVLIAHKSNRSYESAVAHLKKTKALHLRLNLADDWIATVTRLRMQHKAKRNFIALAAGL